MKDIILTGPKHCGKTSAGKELSLQGYDFIDLDEEITRATGKTPRELYCQSPEAFQKAEADALRNLFGQKHVEPKVCSARVISTGGGIIDNPEAVNILKNINVVIVYISISAATAWKRIIADGELPPFLKTDNPQETHRVLHERRAAAYNQLAKIVIEAEGKTPQEIAKWVLQSIKI